MTFSTDADRQAHTGGISATTTAALDAASGIARRVKAGSTLRSKVGTFADRDGSGTFTSSAESIAGIHIDEKNDSAARASEADVSRSATLCASSTMALGICLIGDLSVGASG